MHARLSLSPQRHYFLLHLWGGTSRSCMYVKSSFKIISGHLPFTTWFDFSHRYKTKSFRIGTIVQHGGHLSCRWLTRICSPMSHMAQSLPEMSPEHCQIWLPNTTKMLFSNEVALFLFPGFPHPTSWPASLCSASSPIYTTFDSYFLYIKLC